MRNSLSSWAREEVLMVARFTPEARHVGRSLQWPGSLLRLNTREDFDDGRGPFGLGSWGSIGIC